MNKMQKKEICVREECVGCGVCAVVCPQKCIEMIENDEGFIYPAIKESECIDCNLCKKKCPQNKKHKKYDADFYMAWNKDVEVLKKSSSGGVFSALAEYILQRQGAVIGVELDSESGDLFHNVIFNVDEIDNLRLSKYYQSKTQQVFERVKKLIKEEKLVLFTGTACQVAALYSYLGEIGKSKYLYTMDVLCHGVASKKTVMTYIKEREKQYRKKIVKFCFRVKEGEDGWQSGNGTRMKLFFEDGTSEIQDKLLDTFFVGFNSNIFLRKSCYNCHYCGQERVSDYTVADFWGIQKNKVDEEQLREGVSVLLVNTEKARQTISFLKNDLYIEKINPDEAVPYNRAFSKPNLCPNGRNCFFKVMDEKGFDYAVRQNNKKYYRNKKIKSILSVILPTKVMSFIVERKDMLKGK